jgi:hypothetical protein
MKRVYNSPLAKPTEVEFEQSLLVATARLLIDVEESQNMNATAGSDEPEGEMYFEF